MNILKARAKRLDNGEWVVGYPIHRYGRTFIVPADEVRLYLIDYCYEAQPFYAVDPATLGYETGKTDCKGRMIFGGMKVMVKFFSYPFVVRWDYKKSAWFFEQSKEYSSEISMMLWEKRSEVLEIIDEKDER